MFDRPIALRRDIPAEEISALLLAKKVIAAKPKPGTKTAAPEVKSARVELLKLLIQVQQNAPFTSTLLLLLPRTLLLLPRTLRRSGGRWHTRAVQVLTGATQSSNSVWHLVH